jgi:hypothetical protein
LVALKINTNKPLTFPVLSCATNYRPFSLIVFDVLPILTLHPSEMSQYFPPHADPSHPAHTHNQSLRQTSHFEYAAIDTWYGGARTIGEQGLMRNHHTL